MSDKKLSEMLQQDHDCGDYGQGLEGYPEMARALEAENKALRDKLEKLEFELEEERQENASLRSGDDYERGAE